MSELPPQGPPPPPMPPQGPPPGYAPGPMPGVSPSGQLYASWIQRVGAYLIDILPAVVLMSIGAALGLPDTSVDPTTGTLDSIGSFKPIYWVFWLVSMVYLFWNKGYREGTTGKSIGKTALGLTTIHEATGKPIGFGMAVLRYLLLGIDFLICYVGVLWPAWDAKRQCLVSDKATTAVVLKD